MTNGFHYHLPTTLDRALALAREQPEARFIAGGTDLMVQMKKRALDPPPALISLRHIPDLTRIDIGDRVRIGGAALLADIVRAPVIREVFPALVTSIEALGSPQIRNVATLGGNLCNASPAADTAPPLLIYDAAVELRDEDGTRELPLVDFFVGPGKTARRSGEILTAVLVDRPAATARSVFLRQGRIRMDLAIANLAVRLDNDAETCRSARVAAGAVAPVPVRLNGVEELLRGSRLEEAVVAEAEQLAMAAVSPISDLRSTAEYRRHLIGVFVRRALVSLRRRAAA